MNLKIFNVWLIFNVPIFTILIMAGITGYLNIILNDITYITHFIFIFTLFNIFYMGYTSYKIDKLQYHHIEEFETKDKFFYHLESMLSFPKWSTNFVVTLGFLGTIVGVIIGFSYLPQEAFSEATKMQEFIRTMLIGFSVELNSLLMGIIGKIWISSFLYLQTSKVSKVFVDASQLQ